jgi:hypothetical protein
LLLVDFLPFTFAIFWLCFGGDEGLRGMMIILLSLSFCIFLGRFY